MITETYLDLKAKLIELGYADEIDWQANLQPCASPEQFRNETIFVICNSGMKAQIARVIYEKIMHAYINGIDIGKVFGHVGKVYAINQIFMDYEYMFDGYLQSNNKIEFLQTLPFIGNITKYHLAKNLGHDCVKPDRHLVRIGKMSGMGCEDLCEAISKQVGDKVSVVDIVLWRSANLGLI